MPCPPAPPTSDRRPRPIAFLQRLLLRRPRLCVILTVSKPLTYIGDTQWKHTTYLWTSGNPNAYGPFSILRHHAPVRKPYTALNHGCVSASPTSSEKRWIVTEYCIGTPCDAEFTWRLHARQANLANSVTMQGHHTARFIRAFFMR